MGLCFLQSCLIQQPEGQANAALIQEPASLSQGLVSQPAATLAVPPTVRHPQPQPQARHPHEALGS